MALMKNYTVLYNEKDSKWIVRRHGSVKWSDVFDTQAAAIERAKDLATKSGGSVNIMNKEGKVRDQALKSNKR